MTKLEKDYEKEYGQVPKCACERLNFLLDQIDLKRQKKDLFEEIKRIDIKQLDSLCKAFDCEISELLEYIPDKK